MPAPRPLLAVPAAVLLALATAGCASARPSGTQELTLPSLPRFGTVTVPGGFERYEEKTAPYASHGPIHENSAFFGFDRSYDGGGNEHCRAQLTISPTDPAVTSPAEYAAELGTKLCDGEWFVTQDDLGWRQQDDVWTLEFTGTDVGFFGTSERPEVAVVLLDPDRELWVGLWAGTDVYSLDEARSVVRSVADSVG